MRARARVCVCNTSCFYRRTVGGYLCVWAVSTQALGCLGVCLVWPRPCVADIVACSCATDGRDFVNTAFISVENFPDQSFEYAVFRGKCSCDVCLAWMIGEGHVLTHLETL